MAPGAGTRQQALSAQTEVAGQAESALRAVRIVLGVLAVFVVAGYRPLTGQHSWQALLATIGSILVCIAVLNFMSLHLGATKLGLALGQLVDTIAIVGLATVLDGPLGQETWALLLIPIISAAVRLGAAASLLTWVAGCLLYQGAAWLGLVTGLDTAGLVIRAPGTLLAIAITVGLLARWMREGWEVQNELTAQATDRERRLAVIESTSRAFDQLSVEKSLRLCVNQTVALGFDAATLYAKGDSEPRMAVGQCDIVATSGGSLPADDGIVLTAWTEQESITVNSASVVEPNTDAIVVAWSSAPIEPDKAQAFATLVSHTATAIGSALIRAKLVEAASLDPLTGLANRRTFDAELEAAANGPGRIALAFIDVNDFKMLNDEHGHLVGDQMLVAIARRIETAVGDLGTVARFGGDEFVVLLPGVELEAAKDVATSITTAMEGPVVAGRIAAQIVLSIGVAGGETPVRPLDLVRAGDQAAYQAKSALKAQAIRSGAAAKRPTPSATETERSVAARTSGG